MKVVMNSVYCTQKGYCDPGKWIDLGDEEAKEVLKEGFGEQLKAGAKIKCGFERRNVKTNND